MSPILFERLFMVKLSYLGNSAKLLSIVSALLLTANALVTIGSFGGNEVLSKLGSSLSSLAIYVVVVIGYIAFNGEGIAHKRSRDRKGKKITSLLKLNLCFCFILNFIKGALEAGAMTFSGTAGTIARVLMSLVSTVGSYGFVLCAASLWYIFRDFSHKKLLPLEAFAFLFGFLYNLYKFFNYAIVKYDVIVFGALFSEAFSKGDVLKVLCILQLFFDIIMFVQVSVHYGKLGDKEQEIVDNKTKELSKARNIYKDEGFGIDTLEDDFLL